MNDTPKRRKLQPTAATLRDWLRNAADRIEQLQAKLAWWEEHHEQAVAEALMDDGMPRWQVLVIGALAGGVVVCIAQAVLL